MSTAFNPEIYQGGSKRREMGVGQVLMRGHALAQCWHSLERTAIAGAIRT